VIHVFHSRRLNFLYNLPGRQLPYDVLLFAREVLYEMPVRATICVVLPDIVGCTRRIIWIHIRFHDDFFMEGNCMNSTFAMHN
jgi:hypothetical protein